jgi:hypothetical protein
MYLFIYLHLYSYIVTCYMLHYHVLLINLICMKGLNLYFILTGIFFCKLICKLTLSLLMFHFISFIQHCVYIYIYRAPCKARNFNVVYVWTYVWQHWKPSLLICCTIFQHWINAESFSVLHLCVNTLPATKITLITDGI